MTIFLLITVHFLKMNKQFFFFIIIAFSIASCSRPIAKFSYEVIKKDAPAAVKFENSSTEAESYLWDFGDGNTSTEASPQHKYQSSGNYLIQLKAIKGKKKSVEEKRVLITAPLKCLVEIETRFGSMIIELSNATPKHRDNFIKLAEEGFYDGLLFHRVIDGFMIQGGDPKSKEAKSGVPLGSGGPGYQVPAEFVDSLAHVKGAIAAARTGDNVNPEKKSSGSQFYIVDGRPVDEATLSRTAASKNMTYSKEVKERYLELGGTPFLDAGYTVFGRVIEGLDVIDKIATVAKDARDRPQEDVEMKVRVIK